MDPTSIIPERLKEKLADSLVELLAGSAERLGGDQIAGNIRKLSSRGDLLQSIDRALEAGVRRFIKEYMGQDEDLVEAIRADDLFWQAEMVQDALVKLVSRPSAWLGEERETVLRHFETVLPARVNRERVDRAVTFLLRCIAEELWSLPGAHEIREAYSIQFQELSAEAQREGVALARQQLQATTQMSADLQQALLQLMTLVEQKMLAAPAPVAMLASPRPYHNLPQPTYTQFVGRDEELTWLRQRLSPDDPVWQIAVTGIGGVGKSALALAIAHEYRQRYDKLPSNERFEAIVWASAKEEVLTALGREPADVPEQVLHTLEDVYTAIARVLEREDITRAQPEEQNALVKNALKRQRTLLIMDNLESVKDNRIKAFLRNLPHGTKAIITSRESLDVADVKPLTGLPWAKAEGLIEEECRVREVALTPQQRERIFELTYGLPLPIKLGIARMAGGESFALVDRWLGDAVGELPEYCVKGQIDLAQERDPNTLMMLLACALFDREAGANREALGWIADLSLADRDTALAQLQRLFLVNRKEGDRLWVLPIVQRYVSEEFNRESHAQTLVSRWLAWLAEFAQRHGERSELEIEAMKMLGQEYANLRTAIFWCRKRRSSSELLLKLCSGTWHYPYRVALLNDLGDILHIWLWAAQMAGDDRAEANALLQLARLLWIQAQPELALDCLDQAEGVLERYCDFAGLAEAWATRSSIFRRHGSMDDALRLAHRVHQLGLQQGDVDIILLGVQELAEVERKKGNLDQCLEWCEAGISLGRQGASQRRLINLEYKKGRVYEQQGRFTEAELKYNETLDVAISIGGRRFIAWNKLRLAEIYRITGRSSTAVQFATEARALLEGLGLPYAMQEVDEFLQWKPVQDLDPRDGAI
jgi:LuxR family glucitol operon transcriptional activator